MMLNLIPFGKKKKGEREIVSQVKKTKQARPRLFKSRDYFLVLRLASGSNKNAIG